MVLRFADGALAKLERQAIERRLDECEVCRRFVAEVLRQEREDGGGPDGTRSSAHGAPTAPDAGTQARATAAAAAEQEAQRARSLRLPVPGERVDRYVIERPLGAGGMGMVSLALDEELKRHVVIKLVRPDLVSADRPQQGETLEARLIREAQALARLSHPCVVSIFDIGRYRGQVFFAMEFVEGVDLASYLAAKRRDPLDILAKFRQAGVGLGAAHRAGVVHRDFKPANVLVGDNGVVKVADFGLARGVATPLSQQAITLDGRSPLPVKARRSSMLDAALTHVDRTVGTPAYMAPEQIAGEGVDARSDQFAFAVALIDALLYQLPSQRSVHPQTAGRAELGKLDAELAAAGAPPQQRAALLRALSEDPSARFSTMDELLVQLSEATPMPTPLSAPPGHGAPPPLAPPGHGAPPPLAPSPPPLAPPAAAPARRRLIPALAAVAALGGIAVAGWALRGKDAGAPAGESCAARGQAISAALSSGEQRQILDELLAKPAMARAALASPFLRWTAETAMGSLEKRVAQLASAHRARCEQPASEREAPPRAATSERLPDAPSPPDRQAAPGTPGPLGARAAPGTPACSLTSLAQLTSQMRALRTASGDPVEQIFTAASQIETCHPLPPTGWSAGAAAQLADVRRAVQGGDLEAGISAARALATALSAEAPLSAAAAWHAAAAAELLAGGKGAEASIARASADAERAGDDGWRARAILLEMETALVRQDGARVDQLGELLRSLVARRGNAPADLAQLERLVAEAHDRLGRYAATVEEWQRVAKLAAEAELPALAARARLGELVARSRSSPSGISEADRKALRQLLAASQPRPAELDDALGGDSLDVLLVAAALELGEPVDPSLLHDAAAAIAAGRANTPASARVRAADARGQTIQLRDWFEQAISAADEHKRGREAVELALEQARLATAEAIASATRAGGADPARVTAAADAIKRVNQLLYRTSWSEDYGRQPSDLSLRLALLQSDLVEAELLPADDLLLLNVWFQALPEDSLLRAEAAWRVALLGRRRSRYLQGEEDLEKSIPLWRKVGRVQRAADAAWWISGDSHPSSKRAHKFAALALELAREQKDAARIAEIEAWLSANARPAENP